MEVDQKTNKDGQSDKSPPEGKVAGIEAIAVNVANVAANN